MIASRHCIPLKHLRAVLRLGQLSRYPNMIRFLFITIVLLSIGCSNHKSRNAEKSSTDSAAFDVDSKSRFPVVVDEEDLINHEGKLVTLRGRQLFYGCTTVLGARVDGETSSTGRMVEATGILVKHNIVETDSKIDVPKASLNKLADDGDSIRKITGTAYSICEPNSFKLVKTKIMNSDNNALDRSR